MSKRESAHCTAPPETPAYVLDLHGLVGHCRTLVGGPNRRLSYSLKTLPVPEALNEVNRVGWQIEVVSAEEYEFAEQCGIPGSEMIVNGPVKPDCLIIRALESGSLIHADSLTELARAAKIQSRLASPGRLGVRLGLGIAEAAWSRFGIDVSNELAAIEQVIEAADGVAVKSFHVHSGKNRATLREFLDVAIRAIRFSELYSRHTGQRLDSIDLGSGFPDPSAPPLDSQIWDVPDLQSIFLAAEDLLAKIWDFETPPALVFEPGRALTGPRVSLFCSVVAVKELSGIQIITLDTGINSLPFARHFAYPIEVLKDGGDDLFPSVLCGPLCMSDDILRADIELPKLEEGDIVRFGGIGAYNLSMAFNFIKRHARIYVQDRGEFRLSKLMFEAA